MFGSEASETVVEKKMALAADDFRLLPLVPEDAPADLTSRCVEWVCRGGLSRIE